MIVVGTGDTSVSFWVDDMPRMVTLGNDDEMNGNPPLPDIVKAHANRYFLKDNQIWIEWNVQQFFASLGKLL